MRSTNWPALLQLGAIYDPNRKGYSIVADRPELQEITKGIEAITWYPLGPNAGDAYDKLKQLAVKNNQVPLFPTNANPGPRPPTCSSPSTPKSTPRRPRSSAWPRPLDPEQAERIQQLVALGELDEHHFHRDEKSIGFLSRLKDGNVTRGEANAVLAKVEPASALYEETATLDRWDKQLAQNIRDGKITPQSVVLAIGEPFVNVYNDRHDDIFTQIPAEQLLEAVNKGRKGATTQQRQQVAALVAMGALDPGRIDQVNLTEYDAKRSIETGKLYYSQPEIEKYLAENAQDGHELTPNSIKDRDRQDQQKWLDAQIQEAKLLQISEAAVEKPLPDARDRRRIRHRRRGQPVSRRKRRSDLRVRQNRRQVRQGRGPERPQREDGRHRHHARLRQAARRDHELADCDARRRGDGCPRHAQRARRRVQVHRRAYGPRSKEP